MFRSASRAALRNTQSSLAPARTLLQPSRRCINTNPPHLQSRSWRSSALRWGIAIAGIYYYNTSPVFAEYPESNLLNPNVEAFETGREDSTIDQLTASSRNKRVAAKSQLQTTLETASEDLAAQKSAPSDLSSAPTPEGNNGNNNEQTAISGDAQQLEEEAEGEGAFNPVTGEINWDCPCLGGMAYGPCGPQFREAFSCFVYSTEEPKGMECIDKFQAMQDCFRSHPEVYKGELEDDERAMDDVEGFEQEKGELQKEIEEGRTKAAQKQQQQTQTQTATPAKKEKKSPKSKPSQSGATATQTAPESQAESFAAGPHMSATSSSAEAGQPAKTVLKDSEYDQSKESAHGAPSKTIKTPGDKETDKNARPESEELVPKASHDARS